MDTQTLLGLRLSDEIRLRTQTLCICYLSLLRECKSSTVSICGQLCFARFAQSSLSKSSLISRLIKLNHLQVLILPISLVLVLRKTQLLLWCSRSQSWVHLSYCFPCFWIHWHINLLRWSNHSLGSPSPQTLTLRLLKCLCACLFRLDHRLHRSRSPHQSHYCPEQRLTVLFAYCWTSACLCWRNQSAVCQLFSFYDYRESLFELCIIKI